MKRFLFSLILPLFGLGSLYANGVDVHLGVGYGGDALKEKQVFSDDDFKYTGHVNIIDAYVGVGYKFFSLLKLQLSTGLEYELNYRLMTDILGKSSGFRIDLGQSVDHYASAYLKANWRLVPFIPMGVMANFGVGFRQGSDLNGKIEDTRFSLLQVQKNPVVGYKMGLRAFLSSLYLGMDYTVFPTAYANASNSTPAHTLSFTGGFMFNF